jgi:hypothetical protein
MDSYYIKAIAGSERAIHDIADVLEEDGLHTGVTLVSVETGHDGDEDGPGAGMVQLTWNPGRIDEVGAKTFCEYLLKRLRQRYALERDRFEKRDIDSGVEIVDRKHSASVVFVIRSLPARLAQADRRRDIKEGGGRI